MKGSIKNGNVFEYRLFSWKLTKKYVIMSLCILVVLSVVFVGSPTHFAMAENVSNNGYDWVGVPLWLYDIGVNNASYNSHTVVSDLDGDDMDDVIYWVYDKGIYVIGSNGELMWTYPCNSTRKVSVGYLSEDIGPNIIFIDDNGVYVLDRHGSLLWNRTLTTGMLIGMAVGDLTGDGLDDVIVTDIEGNIYAIRNDSTLLWEKNHGLVAEFTIGDVTGDYLNEVIARFHSVDNIVAFKNDGSILWNYTIPNMTEFSLGDMDGNSINDVVIACGSYVARNLTVTIYLLKDNGSISFLCNFTLTKQELGCSMVGGILVGDITGDGMNDIVMTAPFLSLVNRPFVDGNASIYAINNSGDILWNKTVINGAHIAIGDVNGDGMNNVVAGVIGNWSENYPSPIFYDTTGGKGAFNDSVWEWTFYGRNIESTVLGDINGDNVTDIVGVTNDGMVHAIRLQYVNRKPTIFILSSSQGQTVKGTITITGNASDIDGIVQKVEISIDNNDWEITQGTTSWSYTWDTTKESNGEHTISVRAYDGYNYSAVETITVSVNNEKEEKGFIPGFNFGLILIALIIGGLYRKKIALSKR